MKKMYAFLWCALAGCSIIPEDSFEDVPDASLKSIVITSNQLQPNDPGVPALSSRTLTGIVSMNGNRTIVEWEGTLDPFYFESPVIKTEFEFNENGLLSVMEIELESGEIQTSSIDYDEDGQLHEVVISAGDSSAVFDFVFNPNRGLVRVNKSVTRGNVTKTGFFQRADSDAPVFHSIYPYEGSNEVVYGKGNCFENLSNIANELNSSSYSFTDYGFGAETTVNDGSKYYDRDVLAYYSVNFGALPSRLHSKHYEFLPGACGLSNPSLGTYWITPYHDDQLKFLWMITSTDAIRAAGKNPSVVSAIRDVEIKYIYSYSE